MEGKDGKQQEEVGGKERKEEFREGRASKKENRRRCREAKSEESEERTLARSFGGFGIEVYGGVAQAKGSGNPVRFPTALLATPPHHSLETGPHQGTVPDPPRCEKQGCDNEGEVPSVTGAGKQ